jgi:hypothetical protein
MLRWHFGRRITQLARVYTIILAACTLYVCETRNQDPVSDDQDRDRAQALEEVDANLKELDRVLRRLRQLMTLIPSRAVSYLISTVLVALGLVVGVVSLPSGITSGLPIISNVLLGAVLVFLLLVVVVGLAAWDANLWWYLRVTTNEDVVGRSTMESELRLFRDAESVLGVKAKMPSAVRIIIPECMALLGLMLLIGGSLGLMLGIIANLQVGEMKPALYVLAVVVTALGAAVPLILAAYVVELTRTLLKLR